MTYYKEVESYPLITVVIPTYNRAKLVEEAISSVLSQTYENFELFVIDDGSTDNTKAVIQQISDSRLKYIYINNSGGPARPRNIGIKNAKGKYIAFLDSDDIWMPNKLETQVKEFDESSNCGIASEAIVSECPADYKFEDSQLKYSSKDSTFHDILLKSEIPLSSLMVDHKYLNEITFNEEPKYHFVEDYDFLLRLTDFSGKTIKKINEPLIILRDNRESNSNDANFWKKNAFILGKYKNRLNNRQYRYRMSLIFFGQGVKNIRCNFSRPSLFFLRSLRYCVHFKLAAKSLMGFFISFLPAYKLRCYVLERLHDIGKNN